MWFHHKYHRVGGTVLKHYDKMYPLISPGCLLEETTIPGDWRSAWDKVDANAW
jgi:hypothetical protein